MQINVLELSNFRNYPEQKIEFTNGVNIIYGENGQGKTNILESIYMCSTGKSHKGSKENEMILMGQDESHIKAEFSGEYGHIRADIHLKKNKGKGVALNKVPIKRLSELYGHIFTVMFSTEDLDIIKRGPADRRRFMDLELCQLDPIYVEDLINYNKILKQRRELFKSMAENNRDINELRDTLDIWDLQLVNYGNRIIERRKKFLDDMNSLITIIHSELSGGREQLRLVYEPSVKKEDYYEELLKNRERDSYLRQTQVGPHRDDFGFYDGNINLKTFGSNGQQRTAAIALKFAEIKLIEQVKKEKPVLLLDDVFSELDRSRQKHLINTVKDTQTIITCTGIDEFVEENIGEAGIFHVKSGSVVCENS